jgi:hypothetical protein
MHFDVIAKGLLSEGLQQNLWAISRTTGYVFKEWQGKNNAAAGASRGTVTWGSRSTGKRRLRGRKTPSG